MGDCTYVRFTIPLAYIVTVQHRRTLAPVLGMTVDELDPILLQDPADAEPVAGYANETAVRMVEGVPCLVWEDDQTNYGGTDIEDELQETKIPFLRFHLAGGDYGPGKAAFTGFGDLHWIDCDGNGHPVARVTVTNGHATSDPDALVFINDFLQAEQAVLHPSKIVP